MGNLGSFTPETWIKEAARVQLTPSPSFGAAPALPGQTAKPPPFVSPGPRAADGAAGGARSRGGPGSPSDGASSGRISPDGAASRLAASGSRARGAGYAHGGPGAGRDLGSRPRRSSGPLAAAGTREPGAPREAGRRRGESGAVSGPLRPVGSPAGRRCGGPGDPAGGTAALRRAKGFRPTGLGPAGRNCTRSPHAATYGASRPRPLSSRSRPWASGRCGNRERRTGRRGACSTLELGRGAQGSDVRAPGPLSSRGPEREAPGLGSPTGRGGAEGVSRGSGLSSGAVSQVLLDLSGPNPPLQSCHAAVTTLCFCVEWTL